jgi:hypothetical protein
VRALLAALLAALLLCVGIPTALLGRCVIALLTAVRTEESGRELVRGLLAALLAALLLCVVGVLCTYGSLDELVRGAGSGVPEEH